MRSPVALPPLPRKERAMVGKRPIRRLSSNEQVNKLIADTRDIAARSVVVLRDNPIPDTFAGRKTYEPFPEEPSSDKT